MRGAFFLSMLGVAAMFITDSLMGTGYKKLNEGNYGQLERFLSAHTDTSMFLRAKLQCHKDSGGQYFGALDKEDNLIGVLAHYPAGYIVTQATPRLLSGLVEELMKQPAQAISGFFGPAKQVKELLNIFAQHGYPAVLKSSSYKTDRDGWVYGLDLESCVLSNDFGHKFEITNVKQVDQKHVKTFLEEYSVEGLDSDREDPGFAEKVAGKVSEACSKRNLWFLRRPDTERPLAMAGFEGEFSDCVQLCKVFTPKDERNKGYARTLINLLLETKKQAGVCRLVLFTDHTDLAEKLYKSVGFQAVDRYRYVFLRQSLSITYSI